MKIFHLLIYFEPILDLCWSVDRLHLNALNGSIFPLAFIVKDKGSLIRVNYTESVQSGMSSFFLINVFVCC